MATDEPRIPMNKYYLVVPVGLLLGFLMFEQRAAVQSRQKEEAWRAAAAAANDALEEQRLTLKHQAEVDARHRAEEREQQEQMRAAKKLDDYTNLMRSLVEDTDRHTAEAEKLGRESAALEQQITGLRAKKEKSETETFALARLVEQNRVDRRSAEIELQRTTKMVAARISESAWVSLPLTAHPSH